MCRMPSENSTTDIPPVWNYEQGIWSQIPDPVMTEYGVPDEEHDEWLYHAGYGPADHWCGAAQTTAIYESYRGTSHCWRIEFSMNAARTHVIMVKQFSDLIELLSKLAPIALASERGQQAPPRAGRA
jgi:hypothetical protein